MWVLLEDAGVFAWPLLLCSILAAFIIVERLFALRRGRIIPRDVEEQLIRGDVDREVGQGTVAGRIIGYYHSPHWDPEQLKAFARLQVTHLERGLFILEIIVAAAPLIGLLGTVTGLVQVFSQISPETGMPDTGSFVEGVALALTTTMLGLAIAIPALAFSSYLNRKVETYAALIDLGVERLIALKKKP